MKNDQDNLSGLYNRILLRESPDSIRYNGKDYDYDDPKLKNYTGIMFMAGVFLMSNKIAGHHDLRNKIDRGDIKGLKTNCEDLNQLRSLNRMSNSYDDFRIWGNFDIFSFWRKKIDPTRIEAVKNAIKSLGRDPELFLFDPGDGMGVTDDMLSFSDVMKSMVASNGEEEKRADEDKRLFQKYMASKFGKATGD